MTTLVLARPKTEGEKVSELPPNMGWRAWDVVSSRFPDDPDAKGKLKSPSFGTVWHSPVIHAKCKNALPAIGEHPSTTDWNKCFNDPDHLCGIHSAKDPKRLYREGYFKHLPEQTTNRVIGSIRHHGKVLEGEKGYRSQNATIDSLWVNKNPQLAARLRETYPGVNVIEEEHPLFAEMRQKRSQRRKSVPIPPHKPEKGWSVWPSSTTRHKTADEAQDILDRNANGTQYERRVVPHSYRPNSWVIEQSTTPRRFTRQSLNDTLNSLAGKPGAYAVDRGSHLRDHSGIHPDDVRKVIAGLNRRGFVVRHPTGPTVGHTTLLDGPGRRHIFVYRNALDDNFSISSWSS